MYFYIPTLIVIGAILRITNDSSAGDFGFMLFMGAILVAIALMLENDQFTYIVRACWHDFTAKRFNMSGSTASYFSENASIRKPRGRIAHRFHCSSRAWNHFWAYRWY